jgi:hypothetical protein
VRSERFCSLTKLNGTKFGPDQKVGFKKSFKLYQQISLQAITKVGLNFVHSALAKVSEMESMVNLCSKSPSTKDQNSTNI